MKEKIFNRLFQEAEIARFNPQELHEYEDSLKAYRDIKNSIDTALEQGMERGLAQGREEGRAEGIAEEKKNTARKLLSLNTPVDIVAQVTGLTEEEIGNMEL